MLAVANLKKIFDQANQTLVVLDGITAQFEKGKSYAIIGPSGSGKSTLLHIIAGLDNPTAGQVFFNQLPVSSFTEEQHRELLREHLGLVFQSSYLIQELTVIENVIIKGLINNVPYQDLYAQGRALLQDVGVAEKADQLPARLSGGQQQRVALARALFNKPEFLLGDEITGNLDVQTGMKIIDLIVHAKQTWNMGIVITTHDEYVADRMDHVFELTRGKLTQIR